MTGAAGQQRVSEQFIADFPIALPSADEQQAIVDYVHAEVGKIETLITKYRRELELLVEYRGSLISHAVTGKIDVRGIVPASGCYRVRLIFMPRTNIKPNLIRWACERSGKAEAALVKSFSDAGKMEDGKGAADDESTGELASATLTPLGFFFLPEPPVETLPVPDFRTVKDRALKQANAALLETIYQMQRRQEWMRDYLIEEGEASAFIGSVTLATSPAAAAAAIREKLGMVDGWAEEHATWESALLGLRRAAEAAGILVVINGVVGNNTHQPLNPQEFRGFVLAMPMRRWSSSTARIRRPRRCSRWRTSWRICGWARMGSLTCSIWKPRRMRWRNFCNRVAAEVLIPTAELHACWPDEGRKSEPFQALAKRFQVSPLVAARRALDAGLVTRADFFFSSSKPIRKTSGGRRRERPPAGISTRRRRRASGGASGWPWCGRRGRGDCFTGTPIASLAWPERPLTNTAEGLGFTAA